MGDREVAIEPPSIALDVEGDVAPLRRRRLPACHHEILQHRVAVRGNRLSGLPDQMYAEVVSIISTGPSPQKYHV